MKKFAFSALLLALVFSAGCSQNGPPSSAFLPRANQAAHMRVPGNFKEYPLPAGANPTTLTIGDNDTLWFATAGNFSPFFVYRFSRTTGNVKTFTNPTNSLAITNLAKAGSHFYFILTEPAQSPPGTVQYLSKVNSSGVITIGPEIGGEQLIQNLVWGANGHLWYPYCPESCGNSDDQVGSVTISGMTPASVMLPNSFEGNYITPGPGGKLYVTATYQGPPPPPPPSDSAVFVISTSGTVLDQFSLPTGALPNGIAQGPDGNLWIAEPGTNAIASMTPGGVITQFPIPTSNAGASFITRGGSHGLWFTETTANKIARITTAGVINEFSIPTASSGASAIRFTSGCPPHGCVWFAETAANQIGKFVSPLP